MNARCVSGLALLAGISLVGCAHADAPSTTASSEAPGNGNDDEASASLAEHHRHHHHGGVTTFIALSLDTLGADPAKQAQIEKIQAQLNDKLASAREAEKIFMEALADGVSAGTLDTVRVNAAIGALAKAASAADASTADALNELHALLSPAERVALVDKVHAHWEVWRKVNQEEELASSEHGSRLANLADELSLRPEQIEKISENLKKAVAALNVKFDVNETESHIGGFSSAFVADTFDARSLKSGETANNHLASYGANRMVLFYEAVTPVLTPEQRTQLAANLHEHLTHQQPHAEN